MARIAASYENPEQLKDSAWFVTFSLILGIGSVMACKHQEFVEPQPGLKFLDPAWRVLGTYPYWPASLLKVQTLIVGVSDRYYV